MTDPTDVVQRARAALDAWPGEPITDDDRKVNAVIGSITVAQYELVRDLLALVEVALPTVTAQRDDALAEVERLREGDWATLSRNLHNAETDRDRLRATVEQVRALANSDLMVSPHELRRALDGEA